MYLYHTQLEKVKRPLVKYVFEKYLGKGFRDKQLGCNNETGRSSCGACFGQKKSIGETTPINTAFTACFSRRKSKLLNRLPPKNYM
jgi:hypothetical protein